MRTDVMTVPAHEDVIQTTLSLAGVCIGCVEPDPIRAVEIAEALSEVMHQNYNRMQGNRSGNIHVTYADIRLYLTSALKSMIEYLETGEIPFDTN